MINFPTEQWLDEYVEKTGATLEDAELAWWDKEIDKGNQTPFDLDEKQKKNVKTICKNAKSEKAVNAYGKTVKRERKPNENKREIIHTIEEGLKKFSPTITNIEKQIDFCYNGIEYSVTLTAHRPKK